MTTSTRQARFLIIIFLLSLLLLSRGIKIVGQFTTNVGMVLISKADVDVPDGAGKGSLNMVRGWFQSPGVGDWTELHGLAIVDWIDMNDSAAVEKWQQAGFTADDLVAYARNSSNRVDAMRWYRSVAQVAPDNVDLWLDVGLICQQQREKDELCTQFLEYNDQNWLVDPHIEFGRAAWRSNRREGVEYDIVDCPDLPDGQCVMLSIGAVVPEHGASWHQCLYLPEGAAGQTYRFSTWLKVEVEQDGGWRPLYYQGTIENQTRGFWPSIETSSTDWEYWEQSFEMPDFDDGKVCFHPVRLEDSGQAWFRDAKMVLVSTP